MAAFASGAIAATATHVFPSLEIECFSRGAAQLAAWLTGTSVVRIEQGWMLPGGDAAPLVVTTACSATGFFSLVVTLFAWGFARRDWPAARAIVTALATAVPIAMCANALRVVALAQVHRWIVPRLPENLAPFFHMLTGVAVFLPALIAINLVFEFHGRTRTNFGPGTDS